MNRFLFFKRTFKKRPYPLFRLVLAALLTTLLPACQNNMADLPNMKEMQSAEENRASDVKFIFSENGVTKATLSSDTFIQNNGANPPYIDFIKHIKLITFDSSLTVESTVTANFARYYPKTRNIIAQDSVVIVNKKGERLETEQLIWNDKLQRFYTDKFVRITMNGQVTYGEGFEANRDFTWFRIKHQKGTIPVDKSSLPIGK